MSSMVLLTNENGTVIATDSRVTFDDYYEDGYQKIFIKEQEDLIYGVVGYYGDKNLSVLKEIQSHFEDNSFDDAIKKIKQMRELLKDGQVINIFICNKGINRIIDLLNDRVVDIGLRKGQPDIFVAGSHTFMKDKYNMKDIANASLEDLVQYSKDIIHEEMDIDEMIHQKNHNYRPTIGGDICIVSYSRDGVISQHIKMTFDEGDID